MREIDQHGLMYDGHDHDRDELVETARAHLIAGGEHPLDAHERLAHPHLVVRAWWAGDELGFCGETHPLAQPVTVVHVPTSAELAARTATVVDASGVA